MYNSLTKEELLERFDERKDIFILALNHDLNLFSSKIRTDVKINPADPHKPEIDISVDEFANELVGKAISRLIDLVYQDMD
jgi:hypothetical protein